MKVRTVLAYSSGIATSLFVGAQLAAAQAVQLTDPLGGTSTLCGALKLALNVILAVMVPFLVLWLIYAGFKLVYARGNPKLLEEAKRNLLFCVFGIVVILGAWTIAQVLANTLTSIQNASGGTNNTTACN
jgi:hypothetical protein